MKRCSDGLAVIDRRVRHGIGWGVVPGLAALPQLFLLAASIDYATFSVHHQPVGAHNLHKPVGNPPKSRLSLLPYAAFTPKSEFLLLVFLLAYS